MGPVEYSEVMVVCSDVRQCTGNVEQIIVECWSSTVKCCLGVVT